MLAILFRPLRVISASTGEGHSAVGTSSPLLGEPDILEELGVVVATVVPKEVRWYSKQQKHNLVNYLYWTAHYVIDITWSIRRLKPLDPIRLFFSSLLRQTTNKASKLRIADLLWRESTDDRIICQWCRKNVSVS